MASSMCLSPNKSGVRTNQSVRKSLVRIIQCKALLILEFNKRNNPYKQYSMSQIPVGLSHKLCEHCAHMLRYFKSQQIINVLLSEFLKLKEENNADFFKMVQTPELACALTLQVQISDGQMLNNFWNQMILYLFGSSCKWTFIF